MARVALDGHKSLQRREANRLLLDILQNPIDFRVHFKRWVRLVAVPTYIILSPRLAT